MYIIYLCICKYLCTYKLCLTDIYVYIFYVHKILYFSVNL